MAPQVFQKSGRISFSFRDYVAKIFMQKYERLKIWLQNRYKSRLNELLSKNVNKTFETFDLEQAHLILHLLVNKAQYKMLLYIPDEKLAKWDTLENFTEILSGHNVKANILIFKEMQPLCALKKSGIAFYDIIKVTDEADIPFFVVADYRRWCYFNGRRVVANMNDGDTAAVLIKAFERGWAKASRLPITQSLATRRKWCSGLNETHREYN